LPALQLSQRQEGFDEGLASFLKSLFWRAVFIGVSKRSLEEHRLHRLRLADRHCREVEKVRPLRRNLACLSRGLYLNAALCYQEIDEEAAERLFVTAVEDVITKAQIVWSGREAARAS
jgi:hypothetical protein